MADYYLKTWELSGELSAQDVEYIRSCTVKFTSGETEIETLIGANGQTWKYAGYSRPAIIMTQTADQESALVLKYSGRLVLRHAVHISSASFAV